MNRYDTINEPLTIVNAYIPELHDWKPVEAVRFLLGRYVQPDPDEALTPDAALFGHDRRERQLAGIREADAAKAAQTEQRVLAYLQRRGPCTISAMCSGLALSKFGVRGALLRRPDWFVVVGEKRNKRGQPAPIWDVTQEPQP